MKKKVLAVASGGGHWVQLSRLAPAFRDHDVTFVTTLPGVEAPLKGYDVAIVRDASRSAKFDLIVLIYQMIRLIVKNRPDVVITTGAAPGVIALRIAKLFGAKTIWLDSIANVEEVSMSGRLAKTSADLWLTQWAHLVDKNPGLQFKGAVI
jgi:UDP-N-acetylglucosamine:LPS N-acetylglucosamine transferase